MNFPSVTLSLCSHARALPSPVELGKNVETINLSHQSISLCNQFFKNGTKNRNANKKCRRQIDFELAWINLFNQSCTLWTLRLMPLPKTSQIQLQIFRESRDCHSARLMTQTFLEFWEISPRSEATHPISLSSRGTYETPSRKVIKKLSLRQSKLHSEHITLILMCNLISKDFSFLNRTQLDGWATRLEKKVKPILKLCGWLLRRNLLVQLSW